MPQIHSIATDYADKGVIVIGVNLWENWSIVETFQETYPNILMLRDGGSVWGLYGQNGYIPLNYVLDHDIDQTVDYWMEGYSHATITGRINNLLADVTMNLVPDDTAYVQGGTVGFDIEVTNWSSQEQSVYLLLDVELPNGNYYTIERTPIDLLPDDFRILRRDLDIPTKAPVNLYRLRARLGTPPNDLWNSDHFYFDVYAP